MWPMRDSEGGDAPLDPSFVDASNIDSSLFQFPTLYMWL
jgi:hypothetical protein